MNKFLYTFALSVFIPYMATAQNEMKSEKDSLDLTTQAISTIHSDIIGKTSTPCAGNALYGLLPGVTMKQNVGWTDFATAYVRGGGSLNGSTPLMIVDGLPRSIGDINVDDIESISVLKDAAATAMWGTRGANGVIVVTTKRGKIDKPTVEVNYTHGFGLPINLPEMANSYDYARAVNEALHNDGLDAKYADPSLFLGNSDNDLYPNVDWVDEGLRNHTENNQLNLIFKGGSKNVRYYSSINYKNDFGILNKDYSEGYSDRYDSQMRKYDLSARLNLDITITKNTLAQVTMYGFMKENIRPFTGTSDIFSNLYSIPSAAFPVKTSDGHWGGNSIYAKNPIAQIADYGYYKGHTRALMADMTLSQNLSSVLPGLKAQLNLSYDNSAVFTEVGKKNYSYQENALTLNSATGEYEKINKVYGDDSALDISNYSLTSQYIRAALSGNISYDNTFGKNNVSASVSYRQEGYKPMGRNMARYYQNVMGTVGYNYDNRYLLNAVVNYDGTSILPEGDQFRAYPAISGAWILSNEKFMKNVSFIDFLKLRASYGQVGYDGGLVYDMEQTTYSSSGSYAFGSTNGKFYGLHLGALGVEDMVCELSDKTNIGIDAQFLKNRLSFSADYFIDKRSHAIVDGTNVVSTIIGTTVSKVTNGKSQVKGFETSFGWNDNINKDFKYYVNGNFSFFKSKVIENGEGYKKYDYQSAKGLPIGQQKGLVAIGFFKDADDIKNSPKQTFSDVKPGDIKYRDINGDNVIDGYDVTSIGYSGSIPAINYGIQLGFEYKGFGIDATFQGIGNYSRMLSTDGIYRPLYNNNNISKWYLEDQVRWTEATADIATVPRLTTLANDNNFRNSTLWQVDGSYFKLRNLNIYYNLPQNWTKAMHMQNCQIYLRGNNLFSIDKIDYANCEDFSTDYVDLAELYVGVNLKF